MGKQDLTFWGIDVLDGMEGELYDCLGRWILYIKPFEGSIVTREWDHITVIIM